MGASTQILNAWQGSKSEYNLPLVNHRYSVNVWLIIGKEGNNGLSICDNSGHRRGTHRIPSHLVYGPSVGGFRAVELSPSSLSLELRCVYSDRCCGRRDCVLRA